LGLIFSHTQKTVESIYIKSIPVALVIQIILGGGLIDLDSINPKHKSYTPIVADFVVSRWAYEASMVYLFKQNKYEREFYSMERDISFGRINSSYILPAIEAQLHYCERNYQEKPDSVQNMLKSIGNTLRFLAKNQDIFPYENINKLNKEDFNSMLARDLLEYLEYLELHFYSLHVNSVDLKKAHIQQLTDSLGSDYLDNLKTKYHNYALSEKVTNENSPDAIRYFSARPVQVKNTIYKYPDSDIGRGQMFIPEKQFNGQHIDTTEYNVSIIWLINLMLYVMLVTDIFGKLGMSNRNE